MYNSKKKVKNKLHKLFHQELSVWACWADKLAPSFIDNLGWWWYLCPISSQKLWTISRLFPKASCQAKVQNSALIPGTETWCVAHLVYYCGWLIASSQHICYSPHDSFGAGNSNMISILQATLKCYCLSCTTVKKIMRRTWRITQMASPSGFDTPLTTLDSFF